MEGFIHMKMPLWARRVITRLLSVIPVLILPSCSKTMKQNEELLTFSQVFLSIALPFSIFPLTIFASRKDIMGEFTSAAWVKYTAWTVSIILTILNIYLILGLVGIVPSIG